jgi:uncharacterized protein YbjT (DUF2867 family)
MKNITVSPNTNSSSVTLVLGGNGKTGRRIVQQLEERGLPVRVGSRSGAPSFDWKDQSNWSEVIEGVSSIYISYHPDLAVPGASEAIQALVDLAGKNGVGKLVLLSGRGEEEAQRCERIVQESGIPSTIVRCSWFNQNFSENFMRDMVLGGVVALPANDVLEPFVDADDIADVAVAALIDDKHVGQLYELTGPTLMTFDDAAAEIAQATGRDIRFQSIPHEVFMAGMKAENLPEELTDLIDYLFTTVLDGRNASVSDGVQRALGREPRDFASYARKAFAEGHWNACPSEVLSEISS